MLYKKSVVLSAVDSSLKKAVVNFHAENGFVKGEIKLYNFTEEPAGVLTLGLMVDGQVVKAGLTKIGFMHYHFATTLSSIPSRCSVAIVTSHSGTAKPLLLGSMDTSSSLEGVLLENLSLLEETSAQRVSEVIEENLGEYEDQEELEAEIDKAMKEPEECSHNCASCHYKNAFYEEEIEAEEVACLESQPQKEDIKTEIVKGRLRVPETKSGLNFIDEIGQQISALFETYPREEVLEEIIPDSKWVRIDFPEQSKYYVVGLIDVDGETKYICYGIPARWTPTAPEDFNPEARWLAVDLADPQGEGYWITYQDAFDGDLVAVNVI